MATTAICTSFKQQLFESVHNFINAQHVFRWALYNTSSTNGAATTAYTATNEISGTGYTAKGTTTANVSPTVDGTTAIVDWPDPTWSTATFSAYSTLLFNDTHASDASVAVWDFGGVQTASGGDFILQLPAAAAATAILRLA